MAYITGIPSSRVSNAFTQARLLNQVMADQTAMYKTELQLSTGRKYDLPSENPLASMRIMDLQRLLEQKDQIQQNISLGGLYMELTDSTLMSVSDILIEARAIGNANVGTTLSQEERNSAASQLMQTISQLLDASNTNANDRYLFSGSTSSVSPYQNTDDGYVKYCGSDVALSTYSNIGMLFQTNLPGCEVFGGISEAVEGDVDVNPNLSFDTPLSSLNGGKGITKGSFQIANNGQTSVIDISNCATIGDVAQLINANPPGGCAIDVELSSEGLRIRLQAVSGSPEPNLMIREIASGTTAAELGILCESPIGTNWLDGQDLDPILNDTTSLDQILGTYAQNVYHSSSVGGNLIFSADEIGDEANGIQVVIQNTVLAAGNETAVWDETTRTLTIGIAEGQTTASQVVTAVNASAAPLTASTDPIEGTKAGRGLVAPTNPANPVTLSGGSGEAFDRTGLQIINNGETHNISFATAETLQDVLNILNASEAGVRATINKDATGINLQTLVSGCDFMVGENGGQTASQLGIRTFDESVYLSELNFGFGVEIREDVADFSITLADGTELDIDLAHKVDENGQPLPDDEAAQTIQDVLDIINHHADNVMLDADGNPVLDDEGNPVRKVIAQMADVGNGIELVDRTSGTEGLTVTKNILSSAAWQLGLLPEDVDSVTVDSSITRGAGNLAPPSLAGNNAIGFYATDSGYFGDFTISYELLPAPADPADPQPAISLDFDLGAREMTFYINPETEYPGPPPVTLPGTTANEVISLLASDPNASMYFEASNFAGSTGNEAIYPAGMTPEQQAEWVDGRFTGQTTGGSSVSHQGEDTNPQEADGVFNALIRLKESIVAGDTLGTEHALELLSEAFTQFTFAHADLGAREQGLDIINSRLQTEDVSLNTVLSAEADADYAEVVSNLLSQQMIYEASMKAMSSNFGMTLFDYI